MRIQRAVLILLAVSTWPAVAQLALTPGVPANFNLGSTPNTLFNGSRGYTIDVPATAKRLEIRAVINSPCEVDFDLYVRFGQDVDPGGVADYRGTPPDIPGANKIVVVTPRSTRPLGPGTYYIALQLNNSSGRMVTGTLTAIIDSQNTLDQTLLTSGAPASFTFGCTPAPTLFNGPYGYVVSAPAGTTELQVRLVVVVTTPAVQVDVYVRRGPQDVAGTASSPLADKSDTAAGADRTLTIAISPALAQATNYFIALRLGADNPTATGTLTATATVPGQGSPPVISASPTNFSFNASVGSTPPPQTLKVKNTGGATLNFKLTATAPWITLNPQQGTSTGNSVAIAVGVNITGLSPGPYAGQITVSDQGALAAGVPVTVLLALTATPPPAISASPTSLTFSAQAGSNPPPQTFSVANSGGGTLSFQITTNQSWLSTSPTQGTSTGSPVAIAVSINTAGLGAGSYDGQIRVAQSGTPLSADEQGPLQVAPVTVAVRLTITPAPGAAPVITQGGVTNAASFVPAALPGGAIAQGSIFSVFGTNLGPPASPSLSFPLGTSLGGVSLKVSKGSTSVDAIPLFVSPGQINAIMPSNAPTGDVSLTVTFNAQTGTAAAVKVVSTNFGVFTANTSGMGPGSIQNFVSQTEQPINSTLKTARPAQFVTLWGTGLGPINAADNVAPPVGNLTVTVDIFVGGKTVTNKLYSGRSPEFAGVDQIVFQVPADAPTGCYVPVVVRAGGVTANVVTMAIDTNGNPCSDPANPLSAITRRGGRVGAIGLVRAAARVSLSGLSLDVRADLGTASFTRAPGGEFAFSPFTALPPLGSCTAFTAGNLDLSGLLGGQLPSLPGPTSPPLNAGTPLTVTGPGGTRTIPRDPSSGDYSAVIGGTLPLPGQPSQPLFLDPGTFTVTGPGGPDVGPFTASLTVPQTANWTNRDQLAAIDRSQGATLTWTGGDAARQVSVIVGVNADTVTNAAGIFLCLAPLGPGSFTVPAAILGALPPTNAQQPSQSLGLLAFGVAPTADVGTFTATGLDGGYGLFAAVNATTATFK